MHSVVHQKITNWLMQSETAMTLRRFGVCAPTCHSRRIAKFCLLVVQSEPDVYVVLVSSSALYPQQAQRVVILPTHTKELSHGHTKRLQTVRRSHYDVNFFYLIFFQGRHDPMQFP